MRDAVADVVKTAESHSTILRWEGGRIPPADYVREVARLASLSGHWLLTGVEPVEWLPPAQVKERLGLLLQIAADRGIDITGPAAAEADDAELAAEADQTGLDAGEAAG